MKPSRKLKQNKKALQIISTRKALFYMEKHEKTNSSKKDFKNSFIL
jgi:hypothetical protein